MSDVAEDFILEGEALQAEGPCVEEGVGRVIVPTKGKLFADDGSVNVAIIRPCLSRGKRLRGLPPIYEAAMLGRNANVFADWHMWMGHMSQPVREALEELEESLQESVTARRLFSELGGRVVETHYNPDFRAKGDDDNGYRPGAIMGKVIPYPASKQILEADPDGLHVSIAAWPTSARKANPTWDASQTGMAIEGFRRSPRGSVDWVLRGGAGGRPVTDKLTEDEQSALSVLASYYRSDRDEDREDVMTKVDLKSLTLEQLREQLKEHNPNLAAELKLGESTEPKRETVTVTTPTATGVSAEEVERQVTEAREELEESFEDRLEEALTERLTESRSAQLNESAAHSMITKAGLPPRWTEDLKRRYTLMPSGPSDTLLSEEMVVEGKTLSAEEVFKKRVADDIAHARQLIEEAGGRPGVSGLGGGSAAPAKKSARRGGLFRDFLRESGDLKDNDGKALSADAEKEAIAEMVSEGIA